ncbi:MAG: excinuclease ABC subunit UvrA [Nitrospirae bacterium]|nr:excinuclease ABC subunit UvrA [Nitrospirota bacterium]
MQEFLFIKGAREHNLKNINLSIPRDKITVVTGPSGSGKSSLAIDTIYAEGQRRYVESLSAYARQFIEQIRKPDVDYIEGLSPSISIDQKTVHKSPRSTVGTITKIYDYMRVLYAKIGRQYCYNCGSPISKQDSQDIMNSVISLPLGSKIQILAPIVKDRKGEYKKELQEMRREGFIRARIDGEMMDLTQDISLNKYKRHNIDIVIDRIIIKPGIERETKEAIEIALRYSDIVIINFLSEKKDIIFSKTSVCAKCGISYPEITPLFFSFNSKQGACQRCNGLGFENIYEDTDNIDDFKICKLCNGLRLRKESLGIKIQDKSISEFAAMSVDNALLFINNLDLSEREQIIASRIIREVRDRLNFLIQVGLGYLTLDRVSLTLSGGEAQRIRLATQLGSSLTGVLYILDEPSIGMHPRDCMKLLNTLSSMRDAGNTVIIVEHDEETIRYADYIIDMGPGAGVRGGWVVATGSVQEIEKNEKSLTGKYLSGKLSIELPLRRRQPNDYIYIKGAQEFNLKNINAKIPLGIFTCVTGVSGSGKSTLVIEILYKALCKELYGSRERPGKYKEISGIDKISGIINVDQSPLGRTTRSNPATYIGAFSFIRDLFANVPESKVRGYSASRFSFNLSGGRCESCSGDGLIKVKMHFLPDVYIPCDTCKGKRYNKETLDIRYKEKNIAEVLDMTVSEAINFFSAIPYIRQKLEVLEDVGLGYLQLGQPASTLSGGEAQRLKLSRELSKRTKGNTLYILDEPTTGLHFTDIQKLLNVLNSLVDSGNTVVVIEHNLDVIKSSDYVIDLGPEGGEEGGMIVAEGTPEEIIQNPVSYTGRFLKDKISSLGIIKVA